MGIFKSIILECLQKTSAKGVPRIVSKQALALRLLWLVGVFALCGLAAANLGNLLKQYLEFPVTTAVHEEMFTDSNTMPEIVVCNMHPLSRSGSNKSDGIANFNEYLKMIGDDRSSEGNDYVGELWEYLSSHKGYYQYIGTENATKIGHQLSTYIIDCRFLYATSASTTISKKCPMASIRLISIPEFFNCFKFPLLGDVGDNYALPVGVSFILYMDRLQAALDQHFDGDSDIIQLGGIRMTLKMPGDFPDLRYRSFDALPGEATHVGLRIQKRVRLKAPFGECIEYDERSYVDLQNDTLWYSPEACLNSFIQDEIVSKCNCTEPELLVASSPELLRLPFCQAYSGNLDQLVSRSRCLKEVHSATWTHDMKKRCLPLCTEHRHSISLTTAEWPKSSQVLSFHKQFIATRKEDFPPEFKVYEEIRQLFKSGNVSEAKSLLADTYTIRDNFAKISVILASAYIQVLEDIPKMSVEVLLSQIGGALNLYTGISFVVAIEALDVIFKLVGQVFTEKSSSNTKDCSVNDIKDMQPIEVTSVQG